MLLEQLYLHRQNTKLTLILCERSYYEDEKRNQRCDKIFANHISNKGLMSKGLPLDIRCLKDVSTLLWEPELAIGCHGSLCSQFPH